MQSTASKHGTTPRISGLLASLDLIAKASAQLLQSTARLETILPAILEVAQSLIAADAYAVWRSDDHGAWRILASAGLTEHYRNLTIARTAGSDVSGFRRTVFVADVTQSDWLKSRSELHAAEGIVSLLVAPLFSGADVTGTIAFYFRSPHEGSDDELHLASALANLTSSAFALAALNHKQERVRKNTEFLADASAILSSSMDYEVTLATVTQIAVPHIADWCAFDLYEDGELQRVGVAHADPTKLTLAREYRRSYPPRMDSQTGLGSVVRTGKPQFWPHVDDETLAANALDEKHLLILRELGLQSFIIMPLQVRERIVGALTLVSATRDFDSDDLKLAEDLARRAAVAIENARLFGALEESERKFRTVADTVPCAIYIHDGLRLLYVNKAAQELSGYTAGELAQMGLYDLIHPDDRVLVEQCAVSGWRGEAVTSRYEFRGVRKDGTVRWLDFAGALVDFAGRPALLATAFDVTERKLAREQIERSEQEARTLLSNLPDVIARYGPDLRYQYMSPNVEKITGIPASHFLGKRHSETGLPPDLCEKFDNSLRKIFTGGHSDQIEFSTIGNDGEPKQLLGLGVPLFDSSGRVENVLTITHDLTAYRKAEEAVARNEKELCLLTDILPALVAYVDSDERFQRVNQTFTRWFEHPIHYFIGRTLREVLGPNYSNIEEQVKRVLRGELVQYEATNNYVDKRRHVLITYVPDFDSEHRVRGFAALVQDVTERRLAEDALRKTEKLAAVGRLAASISHEINNPLESVTNLVFLAKSAPEISQRTRSFLTTAERELARVSQIATQTLRFYRQSSKPTFTDLRETVNSILGLYEARLTNAQIEATREYSSHACMANILEGEMRQVIANLIGNAIDATPPGGRIRVRVAPTHPPRGEVGVRITIADTGSGISPELRARIFEPFFTTKTNTGTGLGLWITREIVAKHRGTIRVRSRQQRGISGTVFVVFLPKEFVELLESA